MGHADEALELLTGVPAGKRLPDGTFEPDTVNYRVDQKLKQMMELAKELMQGEEGPGKSPEPAASARPAASNAILQALSGEAARDRRSENAIIGSDSVQEVKRARGSDNLALT